MRFKWDKRYLYWGVTAFCVIAAGGLCYLLLQNWRSLTAFARVLIQILSPVLYGLFIAYLLYRPAEFFERRVFGKLLEKRMKKRGKRFSRALSITTVMLFTLVALGGGLWLMLPRIYTSLESLVHRLPSYLNISVEWLQSILDNNPEIEQALVGMAGSLTQHIRDFIQTSILAQANTIFVAVTGGVFDVVREIINIIIGFAAAIYILYNRDNVKAQSKKFLYSALKPKSAEGVLLSIGFVDKTCGSYVKARILDSLIVGVVCYIGMIILGMPYAMLISVLVGVTNIIPYFGPFIGGVPSGLLILLDQPQKCIPFIIFMVVLQQLDGNILYPRIQGSSIGLSGFWIMFAILLFGGMFGFTGLLLGVPVFTVIYYAIGSVVASRLSSKGLPNDAKSYSKPGAVVPPETGDAAADD